MIAAQTGPVPDRLRDGRSVLILARWGWESFTQPEKAASWRVAEFDPTLGFDWEAERNVPGWRSVTANPYKDYAPVEAIAWAEIPALPHQAQSAPQTRQP